MSSSSGFVRAKPATVQLTTGANQATSVASDSGVITGGIWNGQHLAPAYIPSASSLGFGTVSSVAMSVPGVLFSVAGSPVTTTGTLALSLLTQSANTVLAGPTSGGAATPTFRALVAADIPSLAASKITSGTFASALIAGSYTGITGVGTLSVGSIPSSLITGLAASATTDTTVATNITSGTLPTGRLTGSYTGITAIGAATATSLSTGTLSITGGSANTKFDTTGTDTYFQANAIRVWFATSAGVFALGSASGAGMVRSAVTGGVAFVNTSVSNTSAAGTPSMSYDVDVGGVNGTLTATRSRVLVSSKANAVTRTLPTPANSYVGQTVALVQEAGNIVTLGVPSGVTVSMQSLFGTSTTSITSKTGSNWASNGAAGADGTSAILVCTSTDASTVATWRQIGGCGLWA